MNQYKLRVVSIFTCFSRMFVLIVLRVCLLQVIFQIVKIFGDNFPKISISVPYNVYKREEHLIGIHPCRGEHDDVQERIAKTRLPVGFFLLRDRRFSTTYLRCRRVFDVIPFSEWLRSFLSFYSTL